MYIHCKKCLFPLLLMWGEACWLQQEDQAHLQTHVKKNLREYFQLITAHRRRKGRNDWVCKAVAYTEGCMEFCSSPGTAPSSAMPQAHPHRLQKHRKCNEAVYARMSPKRMSPVFPLMCWWVFINLQWGATCPSTVAQLAHPRKDIEIL